MSYGTILTINFTGTVLSSYIFDITDLVMSEKGDFVKFLLPSQKTSTLFLQL